MENLECLGHGEVTPAAEISVNTIAHNPGTVIIPVVQ